eukprot:2766430-Alexandrium_andersonii.AAC.1
MGFSVLRLRRQYLHVSVPCGPSQPGSSQMLYASTRLVKIGAAAMPPRCLVAYQTKMPAASARTDAVWTSTRHATGSRVTVVVNKLGMLCRAATARAGLD